MRNITTTILIIVLLIPLVKPSTNSTNCFETPCRGNKHCSGGDCIKGLSCIHNLFDCCPGTTCRSNGVCVAKKYNKCD